MQHVWPEVGDVVGLDNTAIVWEPAFDPDDPLGTGPAPLPAAFREALFDAGTAPPRLILSFGEGLPATWIIRSTEGQEIMRSEEWSGEPGDAKRPWTDPTAPVVLHVQLGEQPQAAGWPVNVVDASALPPPAALRDLTLEELLQVLASTRPLHQSVVELLRKRSGGPKTDAELDAHKRVNTETFLLRRTKRVALALERLRERLERPAASAEALDWRLNGPVGPRALADALRKGARTPNEARFFLAELALTIRRVRAASVAVGGLDVDFVSERLRACIEDLQALAASPEGEADSAMDRYITEAFAEATKR